MRNRFWRVAGLTLLAGACAADEPDVDLETAEPPVAVAPAGGEMPMGGEMGVMASTVSMSPLGDSQVTGEAILTPAANQTEVSVTLNGLEPGGTHPGHIHQGTCDSVGSVVVPLTEITADASGSGTATATAAVPADSVMAGNHIVVYHAPGGTPIVCGEVQGHTM